MVFNETNPTKGNTMEFNLHKNQQWAFIDGVLCGIVIGVIAIKYRQNKKEMKDLLDDVEDLENQMNLLRR